MENKLYVGGMSIPAVALTGVAIWCGLTQSWLLALVPAALAVGLFRGAWWAGHCEPFAQATRKHFDVGTSAAVERWQQHRAEREAAAAKAAAAHPPAAPKSP
jgi:hypothetical protein